MKLFNFKYYEQGDPLHVAWFSLRPSTRGFKCSVRIPLTKRIDRRSPFGEIAAFAYLVCFHSKQKGKLIIKRGFDTSALDAV